MARVVIKKSLVNEITRNVEKETETLLDYFTKIEKKLNIVKEAYNSDNSSGASIDEMIVTIENARTSYLNLNQKFFNALEGSIEEYSNEDLKTASKINNKEAAPLISGGIKKFVDAISNPKGKNESVSNNTSEVSTSTMGMSVKENKDGSYKSSGSETYEKLKESIKEKIGINPNNKSDVVADVKVHFPEGGIRDGADYLDDNYRNKYYDELQKEGNYNFEYLKNGKVRVTRDGESFGYIDRYTADLITTRYQSDLLYNYKEGSNQKDSAQYVSFSDQATYDVHQEKARLEVDNASRIGGQAAQIGNNAVGDMDIKKIYNSKNPHAIDAYEAAVRNVSVDNKVADDIINYSRSLQENSVDHNDNI